jgi:ribonuclease HI
MSKSKKYYVVWVGKKPGIYTSWEICKEQVHGFEGARYKSFSSISEAELAYSQGYNHSISRSRFTVEKPTQSTDVTPIYPSWSVDAACSGNPGAMEYRGVDTLTKEEIFHLGPFPLGTNNIGEFLAIVHALALQKKQNLNIPIYTDSKIAINWVKEKKLGSTLVRNKKTEKLWELIDRAEAWLRDNKIHCKIIKWPTETWGEIPADFGRK